MAPRLAEGPGNSAIGAFPLSSRISTGKSLCHSPDQGKRRNHPKSMMGDQEEWNEHPNRRVDITLP